MSRCARKLGKKDVWLEKAFTNHAGIGVHSYWQALALREAGRGAEADKLLDRMLAEADAIYADRDLPPYFGVGAHAFMPFQYDVTKYNTMIALQLRGYALLARGERAESGEIVQKLMNIDCGEFASVLLRDLLHE